MSAEAKKIVVEKSLTGLFNLGFHRGQILTVGVDVDQETADKILGAGCGYYEGENPVYGGTLSGGSADVNKTSDKKTASNIITEAENKASEILLKAENDASEIISNAKTEADKVIQAADEVKNSADDILAKAHKSATEVIEKAETEAAQIIADAKETAAQSLKVTDAETVKTAKPAKETATDKGAETSEKA